MPGNQPLNEIATPQVINGHEVVRLRSGGEIHVRPCGGHQAAQAEVYMPQEQRWQFRCPDCGGMIVVVEAELDEVAPEP